MKIEYVITIQYKVVQEVDANEEVMELRDLGERSAQYFFDSLPDNGACGSYNILYASCRNKS